MRHPLALAAICLTLAALAAGGPGTRAEETHEAAPPAMPEVAAPGEPPRTDACLSPADMREEVSERRVIAPVAAIKAARTVIPRAEIQRASLCRHADGLVYMLTALRRDGHFVHVMVDAKTGQVAGQY
ncbi:PepSY domain-containing protein [uncultured Methylobacterium sp.]|uniref:PepSY domain-containing protein n=1 Tax=uncultured Methylobacterium sp. TaxID=157278 RepID=UPI0035CB1EC5